MDGYNQNSEDVLFFAKEFVEDFALKHQKNINEEMINDLFIIIKEAYGDGFIHGFNLGVEDTSDWYIAQDSDEAWINEQSIRLLEERNNYSKDMPDEEDLPPGSPFGRRNKDD